MLGDRLHVGKHRDLEPEEMSELLAMVGLEQQKKPRTSTGKRKQLGKKRR
jgi:DNA-directed RNA polymerase subunit H (RpoH/RPB5)